MQQFVSVHWSQLVEVLAVRCRPFYIPKEFTVVIIVAVYIPPSASTNAKASGTLSELYKIISDLRTAHPDSFFIVAGDLNNATLKSVLPKFHQNIDIATRGDNTLDMFTKTCMHTRLHSSPTLDKRTTSLYFIHPSL